MEGRRAPWVRPPALPPRAPARPGRVGPVGSPPAVLCSPPLPSPRPSEPRTAPPPPFHSSGPLGAHPSTRSGPAATRKESPAADFDRPWATWGC